MNHSLLLIAAGLGVVPVLKRYRWYQVVMSFLPQLLIGLGVAVGLWIAAALIPWRRIGRRRAAWAAGGLALLLAAAWATWHFAFRQTPAPPPPVAPSQTWATFMAGPTRTGCIDGLALPARAGKLWSYRDGLNRAGFAGSAAVVGGRVYVGSDNCRLYCLDATDGRVLWQFDAAHELFGAPVVAGGRLFVGEGLHEAADAKLYCLDATTGERLWTFQTNSHVEFGATWHAGRLYFGAGDDGVYCIDPADGKPIWRFPGVHVDMSPAVSDAGVFFGNVYGEATFFRVGLDGKLVWRQPAPMGVTGSPATDGQRVYFGVGNGDFAMSAADPAGGVVCLAVEDGRTLWRTQQVGDAVLTSVALADRAALFGSRDGRLYCVDADDGRSRWQCETGAPVLSSPAVSGGRVCFGCDDGLVRCLSLADGGELWRFDASAAAFNNDARVIAAPTIAGGRVYVGSMNFFFFCLGAPD
ncbi:MAG: Outer membrane protein assembly factor BamB [Phycisphaerae bacterium]|nr:Outer membrane protein assembly factor BamB [Phycisphaerae bacterium]